MSQAVTHFEDRAPSGAGASAIVSALLVLWTGLILTLGAAHAFVANAGQPPLGLLVAVLGPVVTFVIAYRASSAFQELVLNADLRFFAAPQAWRFGGLSFISLYAYGILPAYFAWPAGLGDMAIGFAAPWMLLGLSRDPGFVASRRFVTWNVLGILDLVVAVSLGATVPLLFPKFAGGMVSTGAMSTLPEVLVPALFVPAFLILHIIALLQARRAAVR